MAVGQEKLAFEEMRFQTWDASDILRLRICGKSFSFVKALCLDERDDTFLCLNMSNLAQFRTNLSVAY